VIVDLTLDTVSDKSTAIAIFRGRILLGATARRFRARVGLLIARHRRVVLDLSGVTQLDANGIGMLAAVIRDARERHVRLVLATPKNPARRLVKLSRLDTLVDCVKSPQLRRGMWAGGRVNVSRLAHTNLI
jgi:anti-anti-sigma factor